MIVAGVLYSCTAKKTDSGISVPFEKYTLPNGLTVILHEDKSDPIAAVAVVFHVGSSREVPGKTGFAHLFEHMMFQKSENVGEDQLFKLIQGAGGELNGGTSFDNTVYYEVIPKNAVEMALWLESDRLGYLENTVTQAAFANQQNVVQNEKRQSVDNAPYGHNDALILKNLYPKGHPYSWDVIGEMEDLQNATVADVKAFHKKFYTPNNATLVVAGDINKEEIKALVEKYFGEIPAGEPVEKRTPLPAALNSTIRLYHEDNFAKAPRLTMVFPVPEQFSKDSYALDYLGQLLSSGKKTPLYKVLVKDKKLTSSVNAYNQSLEIAGSFEISVTANPGVSLAEVEKGIYEGFEMFEKEGFTEADLTALKARNETGFYNQFSSILSKSFTLGQYQMFKEDPAFYAQDFKAGQDVTSEDIKNVYQKYIKGKNFVMTSFVPKGEISLVADGSVNAGIIEEDVTKAAEVKTTDFKEEPVVKTPTKFDRSVQPPVGPDPEVTLPAVWTSSLSNGMKLFGIKQSELPLVQYSIIISGGHLLDGVDKAGLASMTASLMNEGTKNKTPEELEDAIKLLGASISFYGGSENITVRVSTLVRNFEKTIALVEEMLFEPRWDEEQFNLTKSRVINNLKRNKANPSYLASNELSRLIFGENNILAVETAGTEESVNSITKYDLIEFYNKNFSPSLAKFIVAGDIDQQRVEAALAGINTKWQAKEVPMPPVKVAAPPEKSQIYFVDVPGAKQSVIYIGCPSITRTDPDYYSAYVTNYKLGGSFNGLFNLILREEKGFTYGARSSFNGAKNYGTFMASSMVRTNSTLESLTIFKTEMEKYRENIPQEYIDFTKSALLKSNARNFETLGSLLGMLNNIAVYDLPVDYVKKEEAFVKGLTVEKQLELARKYIDPSRMYYVVAGDAVTQLKELEKVGLGKPVLVKE
ncbi:MAG TPA: peptidase M16 [Bacteroidales bacterium]|nr:peptidase M16 [Bacteroidales bacterium]HBZ22094.1 peptidase M16 [Bacteroidales bacterium]